MQLKSRASGKISLDMTPLIDIVFQLLTFFVMTLRMTTAEGDFEVHMPASLGAAPGIVTQVLPPLKVRLAADEQGNIKSVRLNEQPLASLDDLHLRIGQMLGGDARLAAEAEVEINSDFNLSYEHTMAAITAVSGHCDAAGHVTKWIEKIRFTSPRTL